MAFAMAEGALSSVIRSEYGYHLIHVLKKRRRGQVKEFADVRDEIIRRLRITKERSVYYDLIFQLQNKTKVEVTVPEGSDAAPGGLNGSQSEPDSD